MEIRVHLLPIHLSEKDRAMPPSRHFIWTLKAKWQRQCGDVCSLVSSSALISQDAIISVVSFVTLYANLQRVNRNADILENTAQVSCCSFLPLTVFGHIGHPLFFSWKLLLYF